MPPRLALDRKANKPTSIGLGQTPQIHGVPVYGFGSRGSPGALDGLGNLAGPLSGPRNDANKRKPSAGATKAAGTVASAGGATLAWVASGGAAAAAGAAGGTAAGAGAGAAAATAIAGATSLTIPVAGLIVGGALLATAGVIVLVSMFRSKGRKAALAEAAKMGPGGMAFAKEYVRLSKLKPEVVAKEQRKLADKVAKLQAKGKLDRKRGDKIVDRLNAANVIVGSQQAAPNQPLVAGESSTVPSVVAQRGVVGDTLANAQAAIAGDWKVAAGVGVGVVVVGGVALTLYRRRR